MRFQKQKIHHINWRIFFHRKFFNDNDDYQDQESQVAVVNNLFTTFCS